MGSVKSKLLGETASQRLQGSHGGGRMVYWRLRDGQVKRSQLSPGARGKDLNIALLDEEWQATGADYMGKALTQGEVWYEKEQEENDMELVGFPVRPKVPLRTCTYKLGIDFSFFLKEKGGLKGIFYNKRRHAILNLYAHNEWGILPDWQNYTEGPGTRYPLCFGILWKLCPVEIHEDDTEDGHLLPHPAYDGQAEDPWGESLVWVFDEKLAYTPGAKMAEWDRLEREKRMLLAPPQTASS
ncbi:nef protein [Simian immunodeficiency virus]|uniref:Protein Nef n=1 Tax=Simian immunodeficiency virus TaxID=11723 RepID=I6LDH2_SIV|nr:nef protein [Simian immunodeficiency virus]